MVTYITAQYRHVVVCSGLYPVRSQSLHGGYSSGRIKSAMQPSSTEKSSRTTLHYVIQNGSARDLVLPPLAFTLGDYWCILKFLCMKILMWCPLDLGDLIKFKIKAHYAYHSNITIIITKSCTCHAYTHRFQCCREETKEPSPRLLQGRRWSSRLNILSNFQSHKST